jgi:hypothetical protein
VTDRWLIVGCSRRKLNVDGPVEAIHLYQGGLVPELRALTEARPELVSSVSIISGRYGLLAATDKIRSYDVELDESAALALQPLVTEQIRRRVASVTPKSVLVLAEPPYALALAALDNLRTVVHWCTNPTEMRPEATRVLRSWGWLSGDLPLTASRACPTA